MRRTFKDTDNRTSSAPRRYYIAGGVLVALLTIIYFTQYAVLSWLGWGYHNPLTPPGYVGYVVQGAIFDKTKFVKIQVGPASPGSGWLYSVINFPKRYVTYTEDFLNPQQQITAADNNPIRFRLYVMWRVRPGEQSYRTFVEKFTTLEVDDSGDKILRTAYNNALGSTIRNEVVKSISSRQGRAVDVQDHLGEVAQEVQRHIQEFAKKTPFEVKLIATGAIDYPDPVTNQVEAKLALTALKDQRKTELAIQEKDNTIRVLDAQALAESANIINSRLSDPYLQHLALEVQKKNIENGNPTTLYVEVGPMGVPTAPGNWHPPAAIDAKGSPK